MIEVFFADIQEFKGIRIFREVDDIVDRHMEYKAKCKCQRMEQFGHQILIEMTEDVRKRLVSEILEKKFLKVLSDFILDSEVFGQLIAAERSYESIEYLADGHAVHRVDKPAQAVGEHIFVFFTAGNEFDRDLCQQRYLQLENSFIQQSEVARMFMVGRHYAFGLAEPCHTEQEFKYITHGNAAYRFKHGIKLFVVRSDAFAVGLGQDNFEQGKAVELFIELIVLFVVHGVYDILNADVFYAVIQLEKSFVKGFTVNELSDEIINGYRIKSTEHDLPVLNYFADRNISDLVVDIFEHLGKHVEVYDHAHKVVKTKFVEVFEKGFVSLLSVGNRHYIADGVVLNRFVDYLDGFRSDEVSVLVVEQSVEYIRYAYGINIFNKEIFKLEMFAFVMVAQTALAQQRHDNLIHGDVVEAEEHRTDRLTHLGNGSSVFVKLILVIPFSVFSELEFAFEEVNAHHVSHGVIDELIGKGSYIVNEKADSKILEYVPEPGHGFGKLLKELVVEVASEKVVESQSIQTVVKNESIVFVLDAVDYIYYLYYPDLIPDGGDRFGKFAYGVACFSKLKERINNTAYGQITEIILDLGFIYNLIKAHVHYDRQPVLQFAVRQKVKKLFGRVVRKACKTEYIINRDRFKKYVSVEYKLPVGIIQEIAQLDALKQLGYRIKHFGE